MNGVVPPTAGRREWIGLAVLGRAFPRRDRSELLRGDRRRQRDGKFDVVVGNGKGEPIKLYLQQ